MALIIKDRVKETTTTTGTGAVSLGGASAAFDSFQSVMSNGDTTFYAIVHTASNIDEWEVGLGTWNTGNTLTRTTVYAGSNGTSAVNFGSGDKDIFMTYPASKAVVAGEDATFADITVTGTVDGVDIATSIPSTLGTAGQVLTVNSGGTAGEWADAGGGGSALELYAENPSTPTAPSASGTNAIAIGDGASATNNYSLAIGGTASASNSTAVAIGYGATASSGSSLALGRAASATTGGFNTALGYNAVAAGSGGNATALTNSYASGTDSFAAAIANNGGSYGATGANSIAMGWRATAGTSGAISIGYESTVSGNFATSIGRGNSVTGAAGTAIGGQQSTVSGAYAVVLGGVVNTASGDVSYAFGRRAKAEQNGKYAFGIEHTTSAGSEQAGMLVLAASTTDATAKALSSDSSAAGSANQIILPNNSAYAFHGTIVARQKAGDGTASAAWKVEGLIRREGSAGTTVLVNSATTVLDNTPSWGMALSADTTNGGLAITVTGAASTNIRWVATIHTSEVTYA